MSDFPNDRCCKEDFGGSHYHCGICGKVSGMTGHPECFKEYPDRAAEVRDLIDEIDERVKVGSSYPDNATEVMDLINEIGDLVKAGASRVVAETQIRFHTETHEIEPGEHFPTPLATSPLDIEATELFWGDMTHPETGHECLENPARPAMPKNITIDIYQGLKCFQDDQRVMKEVAEGKEPSKCDRGALGCDMEHHGDTVWYAEISGIVEDGGKHLWTQLTDGPSREQAVYAAYDIINAVADTCLGKEPMKATPGREHCMCRDVTYDPYPHETVANILRCKECCLCGTLYPAEAFPRS